MMHFRVQNPDTLITIVGIVGNVISGLVYLAPLPTYHKIYRNKSTQGFQSVPTVIALFSSMLWLFYGLLKKNEIYIITINYVGCLIETLYIIFYYVYAYKKARIPNVLGFFLGIFQMALYIVYKNCCIATETNQRNLI